MASNELVTTVMDKLGRTEKPCSACERVLPISEFHVKPGRGAGRAARCKACTKIRIKQKYLEDPDWKKRYHAKYNYGLTLTEVGEYLSTPCDSCGEEPSTVIDHDHRTGKVRGGLCAGGNIALGHMKDSPERLRRAADYLERHNGDSV